MKNTEYFDKITRIMYGECAPCRFLSEPGSDTVPLVITTDRRDNVLPCTEISDRRLHRSQVAGTICKAG